MALAVANSRALMQQAQAKAAELRELDPTSRREAFTKINELAQSVKRLRDSCEELQEAQRAMWEERSKWLHEELIALCSERLQGGEDPNDFWNSIAELLYVGSEAVEAAAKSKPELEADLAAALARAEKAEAAAKAAEARVRESEEAQSSKQNGGSPAVGGSSKSEPNKDQSSGGSTMSASENLEMRTKLGALAERDRFRKASEQASEDTTRTKANADRQGKVIEQLMQKSESFAREAQKSSSERDEAQSDYQAMKLGAERQTTVIEKLIELNTELMAAVNISTEEKRRLDEVNEVAAAACDPRNMQASSHSPTSPLPHSGPEDFGTSLDALLGDDEDDDANPVAALVDNIGGALNKGWGLMSYIAGNEDAKNDRALDLAAERV
eukprot:gene13290-15703_t